MKNEWDFFADVLRRLADGQQLVRGFFAEPLLFPFDELRGIVLDEDGSQYELGNNYKQALADCIKEAQIPWGLCFQERLICLGLPIAKADFTTDYLEPYPAPVAANVQ